MSTRFSGYWSSVFSNGCKQLRRQVQPSSDEWLQILGVHFFWSVLAHFPPRFFCWREFQLRQLRKPSAVGARQQRGGVADEQLCWSHMAVFAWWGFIASKMPQNVSQLTFSVNVFVVVYVCSSLPAASRKTTSFLYSIPWGIEVTQRVTKAVLVSDGELWSHIQAYKNTSFTFH